MKNAIFAVLLAVISSCAFAWGDGEYSAGQYGRGSTLGSGRVYEGYVVQVRRVALDPSSTAQWTARGTGGALGAALGNAMGGKSNTGRIIAGLLGAAAGGVAGDALADAVSPSGQEVIVKTKDGNMMVVVQAGSALEPGQPILIVEASGRLRVVPDNRYQKGSEAGM